MGVTVHSSGSLRLACAGVLEHALRSLWRLDRVASAELTGKSFLRDETFDLSSYAVQSFGVFQEEPMDVVLRVSPAAAEDAMTWLFHPSQTVESQQDGSAVVRFRAGGTDEICRHLFAWGTSVDIIAPDTLRDALGKVAADLVAHISERHLAAS